MNTRIFTRLALLIGAMLIAAPSHAASFVVTSLADDGGAGELRSAITAANAAPGSTITFDSHLKGTIILTHGLPQVNVAMTITGPGAPVISISGAGKYQPFYLIQGFNTSAVETVTISGLTIKDGGDSANTSVGGGIVLNSGRLVLRSCILTGNTGYDTGGGLYLSSATLASITNCTFANNKALLLGGGLTNEGNATLTQCTIDGNTAPNGGGISNGGVLTLTSCTISKNSAPQAPTGLAEGVDGGLGGGISNNGGSMTITNCTIAGNRAFQQNQQPASGGGIENFNFGSATITNATFTGNSADLGGALNDDSTSTATLTNSIFYGDSTPEIVTASASSVTASHCDIQVGATAGTGVTNGGGNISKDPKFEPNGLARNGGPTQTIALLASSPCYRAGDATHSPASDQRGAFRPSVPSIGAFDVAELPNPTPITSISPTYAYADGTDFQIAVTGTGFADGAVISFGGIDLATSFVSATQLTATITSAERALPGTFGIVVTNPGATPSVPTSFRLRPRLTSLTVSPANTTASANLTGTVHLSGPAVPGGLVVALSSSNPNLASVPAKVTVLEGQTSASFTITTSRANPPTSVVITASATDRTARVTVGIGR